MPEIKNIFSNVDISKKPTVLKITMIIPFRFQTVNLQRLLKKALKNWKKNKPGIRKTNYRLRDAVFSRQRYWENRSQCIM
jgi:leucyl-tRNA synthetase